MSQRQKIRRIVWTGSIAAVTATGAWYGAGLKAKEEYKVISQQRREATVDEKIAILNEQRSALIAKKLGLEKKIEQLDARKHGASYAQSTKGKERTR